jgi:hypothetical protein
MSQARGRHSGSRDMGQRQPRQPSKATPHRQNKPYVKTPSARDPAQTASIFKTRSFKLLVDAAGAENIALGLDLNLTRVAELINGERFTPETAFHIETTLGLPDGFFDEPNPVLTPEIIARLKSPLDFIEANVEPETIYTEASRPTPVAEADHRPTPTDHLPREPEMPKKTTGESPNAAVKGQASTGTKSSAATSQKALQNGTPAKGVASSKAGIQQALPLNDVAALENIRRANLHVLTSRKGAKVRLAAVMEISDSNMANRLYGQKRLDDAEAHRFTERLGLSPGWLDTARSATDIPESVSDLLTPAAPRRNEPAGQQLPPTLEQSAPAPQKRAVKNAVRNAETGSPAHALPSDAGDLNAVAATTAVVAQQDQALPLSVEPALWQAVDNNVPSSVRQQSAPVASTQVVTEPRSQALATSLSYLQGIGPIAEALIKTLAGKARTGRLDELTALELLRQAVLL